MSLRSLMKVLTEVRYDIIAVEKNTGTMILLKFDYVHGHSATDLDWRLRLMGYGAKVTDIFNANGVLNIRVSYEMVDNY